MAQSVERPTLDFGLGHDLKVCEFEPHIWLCADSMEPAWDSFSLSLSLSPFLSSPPPLILFLSLSLSPSLKINKFFKKLKKK